MNISLGSTGDRNAAAQKFGEQDATIVNARFVTSQKYTQKVKRQGVEIDVPKVDLAITWKGDDGQSVDCYYGGVYHNGGDDYGFGKNGKARSLLVRWQEATGRTANTVRDLIGSRVRVAPKDTEFGGKTSWKLSITGPARNAAAPVNVQPIAAPIAATPQPAIAALDGKAIFEQIPEAIRAFIPQALKSVSAEQVASGLLAHVKTQAEADAAVAYAKTLNG